MSHATSESTTAARREGDLARVAADACGQPLWIFDMEERRALWANAAALAFWAARSVEELHPRDLGMPALSSERIGHYRLAFAEGKSADEVWTIEARGKLSRLRCRVKGVSLADGRTGMFVEGTPVDESMLPARGSLVPSESEAALRLSERFRTLCTDAPIGLFLSDEHGRCVFVNRRWCEFSGLSAAEGLGDGWTKAVHPDDLARAAAEWKDASDARRPYHMGYRYQNPDGTILWVECDAIPVRRTNGEFAGYLGVVQDATERVLSDQRFALLFEHAADAHMMLDEHGLIVDCNLAAVALFEASSRASLIGMRPDELSPEFQPDGQSSGEKAAQVSAIAASSGSYDFEWLHRLPSGKQIMVEVALTSAQIGGKRMLFASARDVTERKIARDAILRSREEALEASRVKSQFLANMSHEIRTPMNGVLGMLQLALGSDLSQEQREYLSAAHGSAEGLLEIINDILDLSKIEAGKLDLDRVELSVQEVVRGSLQTAAARAHAKGIELVVQIDAAVPQKLIGDPVRLRQVLTNLLVNAVKFTEAGHVLLALSAVREGGGAQLECSVTDTGIGIAPERLAQVFEAFRQADSSTTRRYGGTGLGLTICRELVTRMGGQLWAESREGEGSRFHFKIPLQASAALSSTDTLSPLLQAGPRKVPSRILLVDDHALARSVIAAELVAQGAHVLVAASAKQAFELAAADPRPIAAAFIDHALDREVGLELARLLRRFPSCHATRFILLRSSERIGRAQLRLAGFEFALDKPVLADDLRSALSAPLGQTADTRRYSLPVRAEAPKLPSLDVLMVEDHPVNAHFLGALLKREGHRVVHAWNGARALAAFGEQAFDVVLMDVQMPELDGLGATRLIRQKERGSGRRVPIVALTANAMKGDEDACLAAGMDYYLSKPIAPEGLKQVLARIVAGRGFEPAQKQPELAKVAVLGGAIERAPFSRDELLGRAAGDPRFMSELMQMFLTTQGEMLDELQVSIAASDAQAVRNAAHRLKGALQLVCAEPAADLARQLEEAARAGGSAQFGVLFGQLLVQMQRLRKALGDGTDRPPVRVP